MRYTALAVAALAAPISVAAVTAEVTDLASVQAALVGETLETFTTADAEFATPGTQSFNGFSITANQPGNAGDFSITNNDLSLFIADSFGGIESFTFNFDNAVTTFAADFFVANPTFGEHLVFSFDNGDTFGLHSGSAFGYSGSQYVSLTADTAFTSFTVTSAGGLDFFVLDDIVAGNVPTPGAVALAGLAGITAVRRRR